MNKEMLNLKKCCMEIMQNEMRIFSWTPVKLEEWIDILEPQFLCLTQHIFVRNFRKILLKLQIRRRRNAFRKRLWSKIVRNGSAFLATPLKTNRSGMHDGLYSFLCFCSLSFLLGEKVKEKINCTSAESSKTKRGSMYTTVLELFLSNWT